MKSLPIRSWLLALVSFSASASPSPDGVGGATWKDYEPVERDIVGCIAGKLPEVTCEHVQQRRDQLLWPALKEAVRLNAAPLTAKFCAPHLTEIVAQDQRAQGVGIAVYLIESQLHDGTGPYGADLPGIYLSQIIFDALVKTAPCRN